LEVFALRIREKFTKLAVLRLLVETAAAKNEVPVHGSVRPVAGMGTLTAAALGRL
jgi:hypothetical protein